MQSAAAQRGQGGRRKSEVLHLSSFFLSLSPELRVRFPLIPKRHHVDEDGSLLSDVIYAHQSQSVSGKKAGGGSEDTLSEGAPLNGKETSIPSSQSQSTEPLK